MSLILNPYIMFAKGVAAEAMAFYQGILGGELQIMRFADMGGMDMPEDQQQMVMHSALTNADLGLNLFGADGVMGDGEPGRDGMSISLSGDDMDRLTGFYNGLAEGGTIVQPLMQAPWGDHFGQVTDKFGIEWMVNISPVA